MNRLTALSDRADALVEAIMPHLAGHDPELQGAVLGDLVAHWLGGHRTDAPDGGVAFRRKLLDLHSKYVMELVDLYLSQET